MRAEFRLDQLVGHLVLTMNNRHLGRIEECRVEPGGSGWVVTEWIVGPAGLLERVGLTARLIIGMGGRRGYVVRWDQLDLANPDRPRLTCRVDELQRL